jgi:hypothetical protein
MVRFFLIHGHWVRVTRFVVRCVSDREGVCGDAVQRTPASGGECSEACETIRMRSVLLKERLHPGSVPMMSVIHMAVASCGDGIDGGDQVS